ncbi:hypothetical protein [Microbacterium phyllosphaerae]|uniref:hypothetical protein n=1 Tax=Microbacterium phyllosphaerae TaxID=124798 RepID=UPI003D650980
MRRFFKARVLLWPFLLLVVCGIGVAVAATTNLIPVASIFGVQSEQHSTQVIKSVTPEEQVVLVGLGIEGIDEKKENGTLFGMGIPGSERAVFIRYSFNAKLGIEGGDVVFERTGDDSYLVTIPKFIFIGLEDPAYELAVESNGILSWTTPEIDTLDMVSNLVNSAAQDEYLASEKELLKDQARDFYAAIVASIDPDIELEFEFLD